MSSKPVIAAGIDSGSARTRVVFLTLESGRVRFLAHGESESRGWIKGRVADPKSIAESMRKAVQAAEKNGGKGAEAAVAAMCRPVSTTSRSVMLDVAT